MKKVLTAFLLIVMVSGCIPVSISHYKREGLIGVENQTSDLLLIKKTDKVSVFKYIDSLIQINAPMRTALKNEILVSCIKETTQGEEEVTTKSMTVAIPIIAATGKLIFDIAMDQRARKLEALKKAAQGHYSGTTIISSSEFKECECALLIRYEKQETMTIPGAIALVTFKKFQTDSDHPMAFTMQPVYVKAFNSVVLTAEKKEEPKQGETKSKDNKPLYPMNVSIGLALKTIGKNSTGLPGVFTVGTGVVSVPNLNIGPDTKPKCSRRCVDVENNKKCYYDCPASEIVPYPVDDKSIISVSMSMTETGLLGIDFDQETAEIKAIKEAIGPAVSKSIQELLTEDDKK